MPTFARLAGVALPSDRVARRSRRVADPRRRARRALAARELPLLRRWPPRRCARPEMEALVRARGRERATGAVPSVGGRRDAAEQSLPSSTTSTPTSRRPPTWRAATPTWSSVSRRSPTPPAAISATTPPERKERDRARRAWSRPRARSPSSFRWCPLRRRGCQRNDRVGGVAALGGDGGVRDGGARRERAITAAAAQRAAAGRSDRARRLPHVGPLALSAHRRARLHAQHLRPHRRQPHRRRVALPLSGGRRLQRHARRRGRRRPLLRALQPLARQPWHYEVDGKDHIVQETSTADPRNPNPELGVPARAACSRRRSPGPGRPPRAPT